MVGLRVCSPASLSPTTPEFTGSIRQLLHSPQKSTRPVPLALTVAVSIKVTVRVKVDVTIIVIVIHVVGISSNGIQASSPASPQKIMT